MSDDTQAARDTEARLALADRMDEEAAEIDDPMCSYLDAVALLREGAAALRSIPAPAAPVVWTDMQVLIAAYTYGDLLDCEVHLPAMRAALEAASREVGDE